jgi:hypothetical protein
LQEDEDNGVHDLVSDDDDQENINGTPNFGVQDDGIIEYMHSFSIMAFYR